MSYIYIIALFFPLCFWMVWASLTDPDPGSGAFFISESGMGKKWRSGSWINILDHISENLFDPGSVMEKFRSRILDKHPGSVTLTVTWEPLAGLCIRKVYSGGAITVERADWPRLSPTAPTTTSTPHPNRSGVQVLLKTNWIGHCAADFSLLNLPKGKSLGRSKPATNS